MRKLIVIGVFAACGLGIAGTAVANYFYPGKVIIGTGVIGGGTTTGGTTDGTTGSTLGQDASKMGGEEPCTVKPIECECFTGVPVWEACLKTGADLQCLTPKSKFDAIEQEGDVVVWDKTMTLGGLVCTGKSDGTAFVNLP
ncbi:hypothetical protein SAMN02745121_07480 [Nannocystis exedens]|uniref:Uncharacterized protein n=1 Tax=Nannocystis exedens TaxID=54 RepID=A0A1I2GSL7_9BACT|nr:hypothetical protein [Nannocystis exedens]PCC68786.1 hypothetical protein NAEX_01803 [Nannocystis exedens]SFF20049.1 hypothetical protein SAMN02745121_07480 [Nannocystis exedens]